VNDDVTGRTTGAGIDPGAILRGAAVAAGIGLVFGVAGHLTPTDSSWSSVLVLAVLVGMGVGGWVAARPQPRRALTAGGVAGLVAGVVLQVLNVGWAAIRGTLDANSIVTVVFVLLVASSLGCLGGYVAFRQAEHPGDARG
jgi:hypothetical protein